MFYIMSCSIKIHLELVSAMPSIPKQHLNKLKMKNENYPFKRCHIIRNQQEVLVPNIQITFDASPHVVKDNKERDVRRT